MFYTFVFKQIILGINYSGRFLKLSLIWLVFCSNLVNFLSIFLFRYSARVILAAPGLYTDDSKLNFYYLYIYDETNQTNPLFYVKKWPLSSQKLLVSFGSLKVVLYYMNSKILILGSIKDLLACTWNRENQLKNLFSASLIYST